MKVVALAGGTGSAKLLRGLQKLPVSLTAVVNVADNIWMHGVYVCPDVDIATYTLAGVEDPKNGWGVGRDTFGVLERLSALGAETWFRLGDLDLATSLFRTEMMSRGATLTQVTDRIRRALGVESAILPVTDSEVETQVSTPKGRMHLQEFWVREKGRLRVTEVSYTGIRRARASAEVREAVSDADRIVLCPANPVTSLGPMLATPGFIRAISRSRARVVALSPMVGSTPFSGPAGKLLKATAVRPDSVGVARLYASFLDGILISKSDIGMKTPIESLGIRCATTGTLMRGAEDETRLAKELMAL